MGETIKVTMALVSLLMVWGIGIPAYAGENEIFTFSVGAARVHMLSEQQSEGEADLLLGAGEEDLRRFVPMGKYATAVAVYLIETKTDKILVDTGFGRNISRHLAALGLTCQDITKVLITHSHRDHIGGLVVDGKPAFPNAAVVVARAEYDWSEPLREALRAYGENVTFVVPGGLGEAGVQATEGVAAIAAQGHTPGHTLFLLESSGERLLIWGDLVHAMAIQIPRPNTSIRYDSDPLQAAATRMAVLEFVARQDIPVAGMHIPYPGIGFVAADPASDGSYVFRPAE